MTVLFFLFIIDLNLDERVSRFDPRSSLPRTKMLRVFTTAMTTLLNLKGFDETVIVAFQNFAFQFFDELVSLSLSLGHRRFSASHVLILKMIEGLFAIPIPIRSVKSIFLVTSAFLQSDLIILFLSCGRERGDSPMFDLF